MNADFVSWRVGPPYSSFRLFPPPSACRYQHDLKAKVLEKAVNAVVEDCVNAVGVDVNVASSHLLKHVSG